MEKKFSSTVQVFENSPLWGFFIPVPNEIQQAYKDKGITRLVVNIIEPAVTLHSAILSAGNGSYYILMNKATVKQYKFVIGKEIKVLIHPDESTYGMPVPEELDELLKIDLDFSTHFENLTPGKQRNIIYAISKFKSSDLRIRTAVVMAEHLKANNGKLDFKMLAQALKEK